MHISHLTIAVAIVLTGCTTTPGTPRLDNAQIRDEVVQTGPGEWRLTAFGAEVHTASQVERAFTARAGALCAGPVLVPPRAESYQYDTGAGPSTIAHNAFKASGTVRCNK
ncbi:MAG: hypothetical protein EOO28_16010 [Comamonadaceae bacterium]|nr:MAG: hypothetical protein EOO28_16010 [Comamonadaceae bacterium]